MKRIKDILWDRWHIKIHRKLGELFNLTQIQRDKLRDTWEYKKDQTCVCIGEWKKHWERHFPSFNWAPEYKEQMTWFDEEGRYIKNKYFPDELFYCTFRAEKVEEDKLYWYKDYYYLRQDCLPVLSMRKLKSIRRTL